jgi:hypothetical protein
VWPAVAVVALLLGIGIGAAGAGDQPTTSEAGSTTAVDAVSTASATPAPTVTVTTEVAGPVTTETVTKTAQPPRPKGSIDGDGIWLVGADIKPGTYRGGGDGCYWARLSGTSGDFDELITNGNPSGPTVVTIKRSDTAFETQRCGDWQRIR